MSAIEHQRAPVVLRSDNNKLRADMDTSAFLDDDAKDRLILVIESSLHVKSMSGFFLWSQGALQSLLPHEILVAAVTCCSGAAGPARWLSSSRYFREEHFRSLCEPSGGLLNRLVGEWTQTGAPKFLLAEHIDEDMEQELLDLELRNLVGHGVRDANAQCAGYYCFARTALDKSRRSVQILDVLLPFVHSTFCRVMGEEVRGTVAASRADSLVSAREAEILHWIKEGKTTGEIATKLSLSPFTVRNHVKNIFRKLGVKSRSHAVAQALSQGILNHRS